MKNIISNIIGTSILLAIPALVMYGYSCMVGWKLAIAVTITIIASFLWIGKDIHRLSEKESFWSTGKQDSDKEKNKNDKI